MNKLLRMFFVFIAIVSFNSMADDNDKQSTYWQFSHITSVAKKNSLSEVTESYVEKYALFSLQTATIQEQITAESQALIDVPLPNGELAKFTLSHTQVMAPALAEKFPSINTYKGVQQENIDNHGRFDITKAGFHGMFLYNGDIVYVEPVSVGNNTEYMSFFRKDSKIKPIVDSVLRHGENIVPNEVEVLKQARPELDNAIQPITTYRLAVSAAAEYTQFHGGTVEDGLAAVVTMVNRLNEIFLRELAIQFQLVANNDLLIFTDSATDPFSNDDNDGGINTQLINSTIGAGSYDLGHVVNTGAGGLAALGALCRSFKGDGVTGRSTPTGDSFWVDYVAHELGHQLGADHTFNGTSGSCNSGRSGSAAYEPGSGSTIMSYAGICGSQNLTSRTSEYYHSFSIAEMNDVLDNRTCGVDDTETNRTPAVDAGSDFIIPAHTPFELTGMATDADNDVLNYEWHQLDLGVATSSRLDDQTDQGNGPLFRVFEPTLVPSRTFPRMSDVLNSASTYGETMPSTNRTLNFRFLVRDSRGGVNYDDMSVQVVDTGEAFAVTSPVSSTQWINNTEEVNWNVAATAQGDISCDTVDIVLSDDAGQTFENELATRVPNTGQAQVSVVGYQTEQARLKVKCSNNIFFAVNNGTFTVDVSGVAIIGQTPLEVDEDGAIEVTAESLEILGGEPEQILLSAGSNYQADGNVVTPNENYFGSLNVPVRVEIGGITSDEFTLNIDVKSVNDQPVANNDTASVDMNSTENIIDVLVNDTDVEQSNLTVVSIAYSGDGTVTIVDNAVNYIPQTDFSGTESFSYTIDDGELQATASIEVTVVDTTVPAPDPTPTPSEPVAEEPQSSGSSSGGTISVLGLLGLLFANIAVKFGLLAVSVRVIKRLSIKAAVSAMALVTLASCSQYTKENTAPSLQADNHEVAHNWEDDVALAVKQNDFRLLATSGRRLVLPSIPIEEQEVILEQCGFRLQPSTSDIIRSPEHKAARQALFQYMSDYNRAMVVHCKNNR